MNQASVPPASLSEHRIRQPHKTTITREHGTVSYLEQSFAKANLAEMEYWIAAGVVGSAMAGNERTKRDYARSLMNLLSETLDRREGFHPDDRKRLNTILETLWEQGAREQTDHYEDWLRRLSSFTIADVLLDAGAHPGRRGSEGRRREQASAIETMLWTLVKIQRDHHWRGTTASESALTQEIKERLSRGLAMGGHDGIAKEQALGLVLRGELFTGSGKGLAPWKAWRDQLISQGANAYLREGDALDMLCRAAPTKPLEKGDLYRLIVQWREDQGNGQDHTPPDALMTQWAQTETDRRAVWWLRLSDDWMRALSPTLDRALDEQDKERVESTWRYTHHSQRTEAWERLMDAPGGLETAKTLAIQLGRRGQLMPWSNSLTSKEEKERTWYNTDMDGSRMDVRDLVLICGKYSLRRMAWLADFLETPGIRENVSDAWRLAAVNMALRRESLGDRVDDVPPSMTFELEKTMRWITPEPRYGQKGSLRTVECLDAMLRVAGPNAMAKDTDEAKRWVSDVMGRLPYYWKKTEATDAVKREYMAVLSRHGMLDELRACCEVFMQTDWVSNEECNKTTQESARSLFNAWYRAWTENTKDQGLLADYLGGGEARVGVGVKRAGLWDWMLRNQGKDAPEDVLQWAKQDTGAIRFLESVAMERISDLHVSHTADHLTARICMLNNLSNLGWRPAMAETATSSILAAIGNSRHGVSKTHQDLLLDTLRRVSKDPSAIETQLLDTLLRDGSPAHKDWSYLGQKLIEAGVTPTISLAARETSELARDLGVAMDRRVLGEIAGEQTTSTAPKRRM